LVVWQGLVGMAIFIIKEPLPVGDDGIVKADEDGLDVGGDFGLDPFVEKGGAMEDGVGEMDGSLEGSVPRRLGHARMGQEEADQGQKEERSLLHIWQITRKIPGNNGKKSLILPSHYCPIV
jgi:hypothetical protein